MSTSVERGVECPGDLPAPSDPGLVARARAARERLGDQVFVLGHHYQRDEVIQFADVTGDSFRLAQQAAVRPDALYIVFCGVHFMAESADILTGDSQTDPARPRGRLLDGRHGRDRPGGGCLGRPRRGGRRRADHPGDLHELLRRDQGLHRPARRHDLHVLQRPDGAGVAFDQTGGVDGTGKVLFLPDQHLGRNTAVRDLGLSLEDCVVLDPHRPNGGLTREQVQNARVILWRGHCSVHGRFSVDAVRQARRDVPGVKVIVHPGCRYEVCEMADEIGSTERIIQTIATAPDGTSWVHRRPAAVAPRRVGQGRRDAGPAGLTRSARARAGRPVSR